jgi:hypothetical protein
MEFVNRDSSAAINIRKCVVQKTRSKELRRPNFMGQPFRFEVYKEKLKPSAGGV